MFFGIGIFVDSSLEGLTLIILGVCAVLFFVSHVMTLVSAAKLRWSNHRQIPNLFVLIHECVPTLFTWRCIIHLCRSSFDIDRSERAQIFPPIRVHTIQRKSGILHCANNWSRCEGLPKFWVEMSRRILGSYADRSKLGNLAELTILSNQVRFTG